MRARSHLATLEWSSVFLLAVSCGDAAVAACRFTPQGEGRVTSVIDARTFRLDDGREVRLAGIETGIGERETVSNALTGLIGGKQVSLHGEDDRPDRYGRQTAYVFTAGSDISVQTRLLSQGDALTSHTPSDKECSAEWTAAESAARTSKRGFWGDPAATKNAKRPGDILARIGQFTVVEGHVSSARQAGATFYINFGRRWTRDFAVTISRRMVPSIEAAGIDLKTLEGKTLRIRGWVEKHGGPRIEVVRAGQIEVIATDGEVAKNILSKSEGQ